MRVNRDMFYTMPNTNLYHYASYGDVGKMKECLAEGANPNYIEGVYSTLQIAVSNDHLAAVKLLLQSGADPNRKDKETGRTVLMQIGSVGILKLLAEYGANPDIKDKKGNTAWVYITLSDCLDLAQAWMELGWPTECRVKMVQNRLLSHKRFDMLSLITGFHFQSQDPVRRIAEFNLLG